LKYPDASERVVALATPSDAVIATSAIGSSLLTSASLRITAPSTAIDCRTEINFNRCARSNNKVTTTATAAIVIKTIFFLVIQHRSCLDA
jgi:hypothetical protein